MAHNNQDNIQADGLLDKNTYYHAQNIWAYPASNSVDTSKLMTELNLRNTTINITDMNYVVSPNPEKDGDDVTPGYHVTFEDNKVNIAPGKAIINGFEVLTNETVSYRLPNENELYTGDKYAHKYKGYALLCLHTIFDALKNLSGNIQVGSDWYFEGIHVCYPTAEEYEANENEYLLLGGVKPDGTILINDEKFDRIDSRYVMIRMEPDPETGIPPKQSTDLLEFVNNHLHSYWLSKGGDNQYGSLSFKNKPLTYLDPKFNYESEEDILGVNNVSGLRFSRLGINSTTDNTDIVESGYINISNYVTDVYSTTRQIKPFGTFYSNNLYYSDKTTTRTDREYYEKFNVFTGYVVNEKIATANILNTYFKDIQKSDNNTYLSRIVNNGTVTNNLPILGNREVYNSKGILGESYFNKGEVLEQGNFIWDSNGFAKDANTDEHPQRFKIQFASDRKISSDALGNGQLYVGAVDRNKFVQNDLFSINNSIRTGYKSESDTDHFSIDISSLKQQITFKTLEQEAYIRLRDDEEIANRATWRNVLDFNENIEIKMHKENVDGKEDPIPVGGNLWAQGYIVAGQYKDVTYTDHNDDIGTDPSLITVPDFVHDGLDNRRKIQPGDIYATQVWTAVYNDIAEIFDFSEDFVGKEIVGLVVAQDIKNPTKYKIADKYNKNIVGIVSENPGLCCGGQDCENGVPVALAGRVKVRYEGKQLKHGDFVGLSKKTPGFVSKCWHFSKYRCGKVLQILDNEFVEVLVLL